jgi:quercetin dioxygenase-like cupin family protein
MADFIQDQGHKMQTMKIPHLSGVLMLPGSAQKLDVFGVEVEVLLTSEQTGGAFSVYCVSAQPGGGPPPHVHQNEDEAFHVLEGEFEILLGDQLTTLSAGSFAFLPRHTPHAFRNVGTTTGVLLGMTTPGGHEKFFEDADKLSFPPSPQEALEVCRRHGMELLMQN